LELLTNEQRIELERDLDKWFEEKLMVMASWSRLKIDWLSWSV
jgi:hypothetical protein